MSKEYDFLKKQRYEYYKGTTEIMDNEVNDLIEDVVDVLNQKDCSINELIKIHQHQAQRIAELEEQLKNAIVPKFNIGQKIWTEWKGMIVELKIKSLYWDCNQVIEYRLEGGMYLMSRWEDELFATKEEAEAKLQELKGENV